MSQKIDLDQRRFKKIIRGKIKENLRKYISHGEMVVPKGNGQVSIPLPTVDIPRFKYGGKQQGGVGQGEGDVGDSLGQDGESGPGGAGEAGDKEGKHSVEVDVSIEELAEILGEELALPKIEPKGQERIVASKDRFTGIRTTGPESLRHFRRTYKEALKRQISSGSYNAQAPLIIPIKEDKRFRSWKSDPSPRSNAVIIYIMDVSGSMGEEQKEIVRIESFWIDTWLRSQYKGLESRYIIHDAIAREVDRDTFFSTKESGGTMISSAYSLCAKLMADDYPVDEYNVYPFHFSDGDNWSVDDTKSCVDLLTQDILPNCNQFGYGQVESPYGSGQFIKDLMAHFSDNECLVTSEIRNKDAIMDSIRDFLGQGK